MTPPVELKARVLAAAAKEPSSDRTLVSRQVQNAWLGAGLLTVTLFLALGGLRAVERPLAFVLGAAAGWAGIALAASWASMRRGSMVGRPRVVLLVSVIATPVALGLWYSFWASSWGWPGPPTPLWRGFVCLGLSLLLAAAPLAVLTRGRRATDPTHPRATAAALGVVAGAWAGVLMDLHCESAGVLHVALGHVAPALLLALVGALLGERLLGVHAAPNRAP
jgi:hypothetical protein